MKEYDVDVSWQVGTTVKITANSEDEAVEKAHKLKIDRIEAEYICDSFDAEILEG